MLNKLDFVAISKPVEMPSEIEWNELMASIKVPASSNKVGRNNPCPCGSGKKYKKCCA
ncbi:hypothetical protein ERW52_16065 [Aliivibrio finisterrensis]|uniref:Zinc chelation protein SecC n=2 Tax=Aliivibrio TaxID=511678 RepID=A0A4Q5KR78_9GAMM|nr:hypothetical protein ERW57_17815 [Aliivibrio finisterrensis]RYU49008.1 hypothetical protein ERW56_18085 [Aliivibrio finisterrensis]RYU54001.1 hypothetical protein ERW50_18080 [Aliivibrio finisterrensis]RYU62767.1 hypothetical protein ERW53_15155 [Aliivibrio finisterrensis]RYU79368.1 hypothetical protein ERW55_18075 [Aliivibrio finisterrensis]